MQGFAFDLAHLLAGGLVLVSFMMIYQDRLYALLNVFALHAVVLSAPLVVYLCKLEIDHRMIRREHALAGDRGGRESQRHHGG